MIAFLHILERLLGLDRGFLSGEGELHVHFDPHWPGPLIGSGGSTLNWLLALIVVALLIALMRRKDRPARPFWRWQCAARCSGPWRCS